MKLKKNLLVKLEQLYNSSLTDPGPKWAEDSSEDVPYVQRYDKEYKTSVSIPQRSGPDFQNEDVEEPELKTKKGKNILREPPGDPDAEPEDIDVDMFDSKGNEIDDWDDEDDEKETISDTVTEQQASDPNQMAALAQQNMGEQNPASGYDPNSAQTAMGAGQQGAMTDPTGGMMQPGMMGMGYEPTRSSDEIGRIFELKKIYSRLLAIDSQLSFSADSTLIKLRKYISQAIDFFGIIIGNDRAFKDDIDEIIIRYYEFLQDVYKIIKHYYQQQELKKQK